MNCIYSLAAIAAVAVSSSAQTLEAGWTSSITPLPNSVQAVYDLPGPGVVYYDGVRLVLDSAGVITPLLTFASPPAFASFTVPVGRNAVLFGENSNGEIWHVPLDAGSAPRLVAVVPLNYDAVEISASTALVSAKTGGFAAPVNDIVALDLVTGAVDFIATVPGFSGPIALDRNGDLYYATSVTFGSSDLIRFSAAQIASAVGPGALMQAQATVVWPGLPSASAIAVDDDGDVLACDFIGPSLLEVSIDPTAPTRVSTLVSYPPGSPAATTVVFNRTPDPASCEPYQPALGKSLAVWERQFAGSQRVRTIRPLRPTTSVLPAQHPIVTGGFSISTQDGPPGAMGVILVSTALAPPVRLPLPGIEQQVFFEVALGTLIGTADVTFDANGLATLPLLNPGFAVPTDFAIQCVFLGASGGASVAGSAAAKVITLSM